MTENYYKQYEPIFGVWRITRLIGEGFQSKVFEMEREDFGVTYKAALKAITIPAGEKQAREVMDEGMDEKGVYQYFYTMVKDQVKQLAFVNQLKGNTNVVSFENHQVIEHKDGIGWDILVQMELLTPFQEFQKKHPIAEREAARIGIDLCRALELCGKFRIIHGDVKPDNIFVSDMGDFKLGGFDVARVNEPGCTASSGKGTLSYMAPEVRTKGQGDAGSDLYSLGLVLYQLLNDNRLPFLPAAPAPVSFQDRNEALMKRFSGAPLPPPARAGEQMAKILLKACAYILSLGKQNIKLAGALATLNANYIKESLKDCYKLPIDTLCKHEFVFDGLADKSTGITTLDVAKRLLDYGFHAPTVYFPLLFHQSIMIEPTETESKETLDAFIAVMRKIAEEAASEPDTLREAPHSTPVRRLDETTAAKNPVLTYFEM